MINQALRAIAEPHRRHILQLILLQECSAGEIASQFQISRPAVSQHLAVLAAAGLISVRRQGTRRLYKSRPEGLNEIRDFLDQFWAHSLERLAAEAEADEMRRKHDYPEQ